MLFRSVIWHRILTRALRQTTSIRLVSGPDNKPKGFGYVEFQTLDGLKAALALTGSDVNGRIVRISVAEAPKGREGRADEDMTWERQGPLAPLAGRSGGFDRPRQEGFGSSAGAGGADVERDGPIRGGKFVASPAGAGGPGGRFGGGERNFSGQSAGAGGFDRPRGEFGAGGPGGEEVVRDGPIRGGKFVPAPPAQERFGGGDRRASGPADEQREWTRQGPLAPVAGARQSSFGAPRTGGSFGDQTRAFLSSSIFLMVTAHASPTAPSGDSSPQPQRQRLQLSARSAASSTPSSPPTSPAPSSRPSPFGAARPVNQATRDAEIEAKLSSEREAVAAKLAAEKVRRERDPALAEGVVAGAKKGASPFGAAKPVDVREKEREVEEKLEKARKEAAAKLAEKKEVKRAEVPKEVAAAAAPAPAAGAPKSPQLTKAGLRKEGFSYSSIAVAKDAAVDEVTKKVEETSI